MYSDILNLLHKPHLSATRFYGPTRELAQREWQAFRLHAGIGGSEVGVVLNKSTFTTPFELWLRKKGQLPPISDNEAMYWGRRLESVVAEEYEHRHNRRYDDSDNYIEVIDPIELLQEEGPLKVDNIPAASGEQDDLHFVIFENTAFPYAFATPDRLVYGRNEFSSDANNPNGKLEIWGLEIKCSNYRDGWGTPIAYDRAGNPLPASPTDVPYTYYLQALWCMMVLDLPRWDIVVLLHGNTYKQYTFLRNRKLEGEIYHEIETWWESHVLHDTTPAMTGSDAENAYLRDTYRNRDNGFTKADKEFDALVTSYRGKLEQFVSLKNDLEVIKQTMKTKIGEANSKGIEGEDYKTSWSIFPRKATKWREVAQQILVEYTDQKDIPEEIIEQFTSESEQERFEIKDFNK